MSFIIHYSNTVEHNFCAVKISLILWIWMDLWKLDCKKFILGTCVQCSQVIPPPRWTHCECVEEISVRMCPTMIPILQQPQPRDHWSHLVLSYTEVLHWLKHSLTVTVNCVSICAPHTCSTDHKRSNPVSASHGAGMALWSAQFTISKQINVIVFS